MLTKVGALSRMNYVQKSNTLDIYGSTHPFIVVCTGFSYTFEFHLSRCLLIDLNSHISDLWNQSVVTKYKPIRKKRKNSSSSNPIQIRYTRRKANKNEAKEETETEKDNTVAEELWLAVGTRAYYWSIQTWMNEEATKNSADKKSTSKICNMATATPLRLINNGEQTSNESACFGYPLFGPSVTFGHATACALQFWLSLPRSISSWRYSETISTNIYPLSERFG